MYQPSGFIVLCIVNYGTCSSSVVVVLRTTLRETMLVGSKSPTRSACMPVLLMTDHDSSGAVKVDSHKNED